MSADEDDGWACLLVTQKRSYQFGDVTRTAISGYKFGDFSRTLLGKKAMEPEMGRVYIVPAAMYGQAKRCVCVCGLLLLLLTFLSPSLRSVALDFPSEFDDWYKAQDWHAAAEEVYRNSTPSKVEMAIRESSEGEEVLVEQEEEETVPSLGSGSECGSDVLRLRSDRHAYTHLFEFSIFQDALWYRRIPSGVIEGIGDEAKDHECGKWHQIPFDSDTVTPVSLRCDGANLFVLDSERRVHYKKVIRESRSDAGYRYTNTCARNNWYKNWYAVPLIRLPRRFLNPTRLLIPPECTLWSCSHRGEFNHTWQDRDGNAHAIFPMVTTCFVVSPDGRDLWYADPYLIGQFCGHVVEVTLSQFHKSDLTM